MNNLAEYRVICDIEHDEWDDLNTKQKLEKVDQAIGVRYTIASELIHAHPYLKDGEYWKIYDNKLREYGLALYNTKERAEYFLTKKLNRLEMRAYASEHKKDVLNMCKDILGIKQINEETNE